MVASFLRRCDCKCESAETGWDAHTIFLSRHGLQFQSLQVRLRTRELKRAEICELGWRAVMRNFLAKSAPGKTKLIFTTAVILDSISTTLRAACTAQSASKLVR